MSIEQVQEFHKKFGLPDGSENVITEEIFEFRLEFLREELNEWAKAVILKQEVDAFDALLDLCYVAYGTALFLGIDPDQWNRGMAEVQRCNMAKVRAENKEQSAQSSGRGSSYDVIKPEGWVGPEKELAKIIGEKNG